MCVTEPRRGGRAGPASGSHSQQGLRWSPGPGWTAGGRPGQVTAEQRSQGDPDGGQAAQRRQIMLPGWGAGLRESVTALCRAKPRIPFFMLHICRKTEDFKHYLDQSSAQCDTVLLNWQETLSACSGSLQSVVLLVLVPACSYVQYLMEPSPELCRNRLTGIISETQKGLHTLSQRLQYQHGQTS